MRRALALAFLLGVSAPAFGQTITTPALPVGTSGGAACLLNTACTWSAANTFSYAGAASTPGLTVSGAPYTGGSATTNFPQLYVNTTGATGPTTFSTAGTMFGINAPSGFTGTLLDLRINGGSALVSISSSGGITTASGINAGGANNITWGGHGSLSSPAANVVQIGQTDAASPSAQTLKTQNVVAGTSNVAGPDFTIAGAQGTGTGAGGKVIFQTAVTGTTGSSQNAEQTVVTIDGNQHVKYSSAAIPTIGTCGTGSPTVTAGSTDVAGSFTTGTTATACTLTFKIAYATAPFCVATDITTLSRLTSYTVSTTAIVATMTSNSGDVVHYICHGA